MILFKMLSRGVISEINGCISTGKEVSFITNDTIVFLSKLVGSMWCSEVLKYFLLVLVFFVLLDW